VIYMAYRPNVYVRLTAIKFFFGHITSSKPLLQN
jgi:hypothetical protein